MRGVRGRKALLNMGAGAYSTISQKTYIVGVKTAKLRREDEKQRVLGEGKREVKEHSLRLPPTD